MHNSFIIRGFYKANWVSYRYSIFVLLMISYGCSAVKQIVLEHDTSDILKSSDVFSDHFTGFSLYDLEEGKSVYNYNASLLFTPASNTKLLSMYVALKTFKDSIPSLLFTQNQDELFVRPVGDPTFLHEDFINQPAFELMNATKIVNIVLPEGLNRYGSGWAWDDYIYHYQPQRSWLPIYENTLNIVKNNDSLTIEPAFFESFVDVRKQEKPGEFVRRDARFNKFTVFIENDTSNFKREIPFNITNDLIIELLKDTLKPAIKLATTDFEPRDTLYSQSLDFVLAKMLKPSDNLLAEQLLILSAGMNGYESLDEFRKFVVNVWLSELSDMVWVDGSGLSRYNLNSPINQVRLLKKSVEEFGWDRVTALLPTGGEGTLEGLYLSEKPFIYAKTGTLSNNHCLSGYLISKSGKRLIFSLMNNHFTRPVQDIKNEMELFLMKVRDAY